MSEEQVVKLLEEIRDLHRQQLEGAKTALRNQEESIRISQEAFERQKQISSEVLERQKQALKFFPWVLGLVVVVLLALLFWLFQRTSACFFR